MKGSSHAIVGIVSGAAVAVSVNADLPLTLTVITVSTLSALAPDLDTNGKLTRKVTASPVLIHSVLALIGAAALFYAYHYQSWLVACIGFFFILFPKKIVSRKTMLLFTGASLFLTALFTEPYPWLIGLGAYLCIAPFVSHRGFTHTLFGLALWGWISYEAARHFSLDALFYAAIIGYVSHLICDSKLLGSRAGIRPFWILSKRIRV